MTISNIKASIFRIQDDKKIKQPIDLWLHLAKILSTNFPQKYEYDQNRPYSFFILREYEISPKSSLKRFRRISISIRRKPELSTLIEVCVKNIFTYSDKKNFDPVDLKSHPEISGWVRKAQEISLQDNLKLIKSFVLDLNKIGWEVLPAPLEEISYPAPLIKTLGGVRPFPVEQPSGAFNRIFIPPKFLRFTISTLFDKNSNIATSIKEKINRQIAQHLGSDYQYQFDHLDRALRDALNIVIIPEDLDINSNVKAKATLRAYEERGFLFKLTKLSTLTDSSSPFSISNIIRDLIHIGGGRFWEPVNISKGFFAIDAGHSKKLNKSRWTKVETDPELNIINIESIDTKLAEHIPSSIQNQWWPSQHEAIFCRDGRFAKERNVFLHKMQDENRSSMEIRKNPMSILWREDKNRSFESKFGDAVIDEHGEITLQSCGQKINDYISPLLININNGDRDTLINEFLNQICLQTLSSYSLSKIHGALYYADLMSKLTEVGWPKVIGRGYKLVNAIPED